LAAVIQPFNNSGVIHQQNYYQPLISSFPKSYQRWFAKLGRSISSWYVVGMILLM